MYVLGTFFLPSLKDIFLRKVVASWAEPFLYSYWGHLLFLIRLLSLAHPIWLTAWTVQWTPAVLLGLPSPHTAGWGIFRAVIDSRFCLIYMTYASTNIWFIDRASVLFTFLWDHDWNILKCEKSFLTDLMSNNQQHKAVI